VATESAKKFDHLRLKIKMQDIKDSFKNMLQLLSKVHGILSTQDKNGELHRTLDRQVWATGHYGVTPHFVLANSYLAEYIIILICSFLDEYNDNFIPKKNHLLHDRILNFRKQIKPVLTRIAKWKDLKKYRNNILAHNLRLKDNTSIFSDTLERIDYNLPNTPDEIRLLIELSSLITKNIGGQFPELLQNFNFDEKIIDKANVPISDKINFNQEYENVCKEIKMLGLTYTQLTHL
jgi:hypothetical protein